MRPNDWYAATAPVGVNATIGAFATAALLGGLTPGRADADTTYTGCLNSGGSITRVYDGSIADVQKTLALEPRHFGALWGLGMMEAAREHDEEALAAIASGEAQIIVGTHALFEPDVALFGLRGLLGNVARHRFALRHARQILLDQPLRVAGINLDVTREKTAEEAIERVVQAVGEFARNVEQFDDITCVVLQCRQVGEGT